MLGRRSHALQKPAIFPDDFIWQIACQLQEGLVRIDDWVVQQAWIGDQHRRRRMFHRSQKWIGLF